MKYVSTRTPGRTFDFSEVLMGSYAPDGGLYVPHKVPRFKGGTLKARMVALS
ncbi:hypothetical protein ACFQDJ_25925 [Pseudomonas brassicacearum]